jgi:CrcB protein
MTWIAVGLGGAFGSMARHAVNMLVGRFPGHAVPTATAVVNIAGCVVVGILAGAIAGGRLHMPLTIRAFVFVGILGGFTTFSTFGLDTLTLAHEGRPMAAAANVAIQVGIGLTAVFAGYAIAVRS